MEEKDKAGTRFVGIGLGKRAYEAAIVGKSGVTGSGGDKVALEAGNLAFTIAGELGAAVGCRVYALNPSRLPAIYASVKKADKEDSLKLAHIIEDFREERLPVVPLPSGREMKRRKLLGVTGGRGRAGTGGITTTGKKTLRPGTKNISSS
jgi:hypothetical protein